MAITPSVTDEQQQMKTAENKGIDYGLGRTNISRSGIRYGVIPNHAVSQAWADSSEPDYGEPTCPKCGNEAETLHNDRLDELDEDEDYTIEQNQSTDYVCESCKYVFASESAFSDSPLGFELMDGEYKAHCGEDGDIFILESPYFTYAQFCSPWCIG